MRGDLLLEHIGEPHAQHVVLVHLEILTPTAALNILFVFAVSLAGKSLADFLRLRYGLAASRAVLFQERTP